MGKVDYKLVVCFVKGISERGDIDLWGTYQYKDNISKLSFMQRQNLVGLLVSVATELCSVTHSVCYHFRKCRLPYGKSSRVELIMIETAEHDTNS